MRETEISAHGFGEHRMLEKVVAALRVAAVDPAEARRLLTSDPPETKALDFYRGWEPLASLW